MDDTCEIGLLSVSDTCVELNRWCQASRIRWSRRSI